MTKVLVVGNGGREHAIVRALARQAPNTRTSVEILVAPGNPGTADIAENVAITVGEIDALKKLAQERAVDLVIIGPEAPLVAGLGDALRDAGIACCGPQAGAAQLEGSKEFMRELAAKVGAPSPRHATVTSKSELDVALSDWVGLPVVKAAGLAAGKGVYLPDTMAACRDAAEELLNGSLGEAGHTVVLEERLSGVEASLFYACNGTQAIALPHARDHKRLGDGDAGPNTGGMGAVSPNTIITPELEAEVMSTMILPTLTALQDAGTPFVGFIFAGLMLTEDGPKLLEYNVRLGDPEAQAILPRLGDGELLRLCMATAKGELEGFELATDNEATCAIVLAAANYPDTPRKGDAITIDATFATEHRWLIHAGTTMRDGTLKTSGGRVAAIVGKGSTAVEAKQHAYDGIGKINFDGVQYRRDIGNEQALGSKD